MADDLLRDLLRQVSRSFYLSLAILPRPLREPVGLAYLLARAADTVADTRLIAREERVRHVETLRHACTGAASDVAAVARACAPHQAHAAERRPCARVRIARARWRAPGGRPEVGGAGRGGGHGGVGGGGGARRVGPAGGAPGPGRAGGSAAVGVVGGDGGFGGGHRVGGRAG